MCRDNFNQFINLEITLRRGYKLNGAKVDLYQHHKSDDKTRQPSKTHCINIKAPGSILESESVIMLDPPAIYNEQRQ